MRLSKNKCQIRTSLPAPPGCVREEPFTVESHTAERNAKTNAESCLWFEPPYKRILAPCSSLLTVDQRHHRSQGACAWVRRQGGQSLRQYQDIGSAAGSSNLSKNPLLRARHRWKRRHTGCSTLLLPRRLHSPADRGLLP